MIINEDIYLKQSKEKKNQEVDDLLKHFGMKGMRWGVRNQKRNASDTPSRNQKLKKVAIGAGVIGGATFAGVLLGRKGHISISQAQSMANKKGGQAIRDVGHKFVKNNIDKQVVLNYGRQVRQGLYNL